MNVIEIIEHAATIADEEGFAVSNALEFANDAIARINVKCKANFPFFSVNEMEKDYAGFSETWQRTLLVPFIVGRIKQTDSSQFEYSDAFAEFMECLADFKLSYTIPEEFKDTSVSSSYAHDFTASPWRW